MPVRSRDLRALGGEFLGIVLAEVDDTGGNGSDQELDGMPLGHPDDPHVVAPGSTHTLGDVGQSVFDLCNRRVWFS